VRGLRPGIRATVKSFARASKKAQDVEIKPSRDRRAQQPAPTAENGNSVSNSDGNSGSTSSNSGSNSGGSSVRKASAIATAIATAIASAIAAAIAAAASAYGRELH
jgi:hypothetical protein